MTRDEAIKTLMKYQGDHDPHRAGNLIDAFVALGILKLDEPKSIDQRLDEAVRANLFSENPYSRSAVYVRPDYILKVLDRAGLKLVEK